MNPQTPAEARLTDLDLRQIRTFLEVATVESFSTASRNLGVSQPTVSRRIQDLENRSGCALLVRDAHSVTLTPAGLRLFSEAHQFVQAAKRCQQAIQNPHAAPETITIGCYPMLLMILPSVVERLGKLFPDLQFDLLETPPADAFTGLGNGSLHIAFIGVAPTKIRPDFRQKVISRFHLSAVATTSHPIGRNSEIAWPALDGQRLVLPCGAKFPDKRRWIDQLLRQFRIRPDRIFEATDTTSAFTQVISGRAIAILPENLNRIRYPEIAFVRLTDPVRVMEFSAMWHRDLDDMEIDPILDAFTDALSKPQSDGNG